MNLEATCGLVSYTIFKKVSFCYKIVIVAESFVTKGQVIKGMRRHGRARFGIVEYFHCHYFVRLEEGKFF